MVQALERALKTTSTDRDHFIQAGIERASEFSWKKVAKQTEAVYEKALSA
jgi:glycosyltransferase involved in cell wall biosynthesis